MAKKLAHLAAEAKKESPAGDSLISAGSWKEEFWIPSSMKYKLLGVRISEKFSAFEISF